VEHGSEQISKIFVRGNHMKVFIARKVLDSTPDTRGAHTRPSKKKTPRRTSGVENQTKMGYTCTVPTILYGRVTFLEFQCPLSLVYR